MIKVSWKLKRWIRRNLIWLIIVSVSSSILGVWSVKIDIPEDPPVLKKAFVIPPTWNEVKEYRLELCLEHLVKYQNECERKQDLISCQIWMNKSIECDNWRR